MDKPLTSAVFIAEARDSTMWTVLWTVWTETNIMLTLQFSPPSEGQGEAPLKPRRNNIFKMLKHVMVPVCPPRAGWNM